MQRRRELPYPKRLVSALLLALAVSALGATAPAAAQRPGACDQYIPNCEPGPGPNNDPRGNGEGPPPGESSGLPPQGDATSAIQPGGGAGGDGGVGGGAGGNSAGQGQDPSGGGSGDSPAALSASANAGKGDAGGSTLLGTDYPLTGWIIAAGALLLGVAALLLARHGRTALRREDGAPSG